MSYPSSYHATATPHTASKERRCTRQEEYVLGIFLANPSSGYTCDQIVDYIIDSKASRGDFEGMNHKELMRKGAHINTSTRRSVTNLCNRHNYLQKTSAVRKTQNGDRNSVYVLTDQAREKFKV